MRAGARVAWRIAGLTAILLSAAILLIGGTSGWMSWLAMFGVMAGVYILRLGFGRSADAPPRRLLTKWTAVGVALVAAMILSFGWLFFSASVGRYSLFDVWICVATTAALLGYLFFFFILNQK